MIIAIDFDGTCVTHEYPAVGQDIGAVPVLKKLVSCGHKLVLNTMRSGQTEQDAVKWFRDNDLPLYGVNKHPTQHTWTSSPKVYANLYIDDAALGIPLKYDPSISMKSYVDWDAVERLLVERKIIVTA